MGGKQTTRVSNNALVSIVVYGVKVEQKSNADLCENY
jgi:hypothetical protein